METKKLYIAPSIQVVTLDTDCSILTGSQLNDLQDGGDPFAAPAQSALGTSAYFDFESEDE
ncbi:hypothetical protein [Prevotella merdae]|uniref:hypothetical protein n=1 Tax=Prevotella merdae TaxID=2079531 RepID=UPI0035649E27